MFSYTVCLGSLRWDWLVVKRVSYWPIDWLDLLCFIDLIFSSIFAAEGKDVREHQRHSARGVWLKVSPLISLQKQRSSYSGQFLWLLPTSDTISDCAESNIQLWYIVATQVLIHASYSQYWFWKSARAFPRILTFLLLSHTHLYFDPVYLALWHVFKYSVDQFFDWFTDKKSCQDNQKTLLRRLWCFIQGPKIACNSYGLSKQPWILLWFVLILFILNSIINT